MVGKFIARNVSHIELNWRQNSSNVMKSPSKIYPNGAQERVWEGLRSKLATIFIPGMLFAIPGMLFVEPIGGTWLILDAIWDQTGCQGVQYPAFWHQDIKQIEKLRSKEGCLKNIEILSNF